MLLHSQGELVHGPHSEDPFGREWLTQGFWSYFRILNGRSRCPVFSLDGADGSQHALSCSPYRIGAFSLNSRTGKPMPAVSNG